MIFFCEKTFNENLNDNKIISLKIHLQIIFIFMYKDYFKIFLIYLHCRIMTIIEYIL